jgi:hypothetical protein
MSNTITALAPATAPAEVEPILPQLDPALGDKLGDEILLGAARTARVARVKSHGTPAESRAWTMGGNVD